MRVDLRTLRQNPIRDFTIDPIDPDQVALLQRSIHEHEFWGGVSLRRGVDGELYIAAGHHRVQAALAEGITQADLTVPTAEWSDIDMVRIYATENATQRGDMGVALTGAVASGIRVLAKAMARGDFALINAKLSDHGCDIANGLFEKRGEVGHKALEAFFRDILKGQQIRQALENLRESGDYRRILDEVEAEISAEHQAAEEARQIAEQKRQRLAEEQAEAERQQQAADVAELARQEAEQTTEALAVMTKAIIGTRRTKRGQTKDDIEKPSYPTIQERTFDFQGVSKHLKNSHQIDAFREIVTGKALRDTLPVENQAPLAAALVAKAEELSTPTKTRRVTERFIREYIMTLLFSAQVKTRRQSKEELQRLLEEDALMKARLYQRNFSAAARHMATAGKNLGEVWDKWPNALEFPVSNEFKTAIANVKKVVDTIYFRLQSIDTRR